MHLRGGQQIQQDQEGRARRGHPGRDSENRVTQAGDISEGTVTHGRATGRGGGTLTGAPRAPVGPAGPGGPASPWKRGGKSKEVKAAGRRWRRAPGHTFPGTGWPYLVTGSAGGAGGADGAGQTTETVFARSAVSTFGTRVALGEEDDGGLPGEVPARGSAPKAPLVLHPPGGAGTILLLLPDRGTELGSARAQGLSPRATLLGTEVAPGIPSQGGCCPPLAYRSTSSSEGTMWGDGGARSRAASGFWGHALCHPWRLAGRQHRVLRAFPADRGDPDPRGHREHQHRPGQERHRKWVLVKPCVPVTAPSPLQKHPSPFTAARSRSPGTCPRQRGEAKPTPPHRLHPPLQSPVWVQSPSPGPRHPP